jgi:type I restriction enzyme S subunit
MALVPERGGSLDKFEQRQADAVGSGAYFEEGDFLLARISPSFENGKQGIASDVPGGWGVASTELLALHSKRLSSSYLSLLFRSRSVRDLLKRRMEGATGRLRVPRAAIEDLVVPIPANEVQEQINRDLSELFSRIENGRQSLLEAAVVTKRYEQSLRVAAMTGRLTNAGDGDGKALLEKIEDTRRAAATAIGSKVRAPSSAGLPFPFRLPPTWTWASVDQLALRVQYGTSRKADDDQQGVPVMRMGNVVEGALEWNHLKYLSTAENGELDELLLSPGDILFNRTNSLELVGKSAIVDQLDSPVTFASYLIRLTLHPAVEPAWLNHWLNSPFARSWARREASQQVGQANISGGKLRCMAVPLPPTEVQRDICQALADGFAQTEATRAYLAAAAAEADVLEQAVLSRYLGPGLGRTQLRQVADPHQSLHA